MLIVWQHVNWVWLQAWHQVLTDSTSQMWFKARVLHGSLSPQGPPHLMQRHSWQAAVFDGCCHRWLKQALQLDSLVSLQQVWL